MYSQLPCIMYVTSIGRLGLGEGKELDVNMRHLGQKSRNTKIKKEKRKN